MAELKSNFSISFGQSINHKLVTIGKFDGKNPCLTCGTTAGKVFVHNPYEKNKDGRDNDKVTFLNINQKVTTLVAGKLSTSAPNDVLFVGTPTNLLAYDVINNEDIYYREIADGVRDMVIGKLGDTKDNMAIVGGNCSIIGLDARGAEAFWTVCGDNVGAMTLIDSNKNKFGKDLLVGSDDFGLRKFENEEQIWEVFEAASFTSLKSLKSPSPSSPSSSSGFSFSLANGTVGVYDGNKRLWRVKSKHECRALVNWDSTGDGVLDVATGWGNGGVVIRRSDNGQVIFKQPGKQPIAGMLSADYRMESSMADGNSPQLIVCSEAGEVNGYEKNAEGLAPSQAHLEQVSALQAEKAALLHELSAVKQQTAKSDKNEDTGSIQLTRAHGGLEISISFQSFNIVQVAVLDLEAGLFSNENGEPSESLLLAPTNLKRNIVIPLKPQRNIPTTLSIKVLANPIGSNGGSGGGVAGGSDTSSGVGGGVSNQKLRVFEWDLKLPKFSTLCLTSLGLKASMKPQSCIKFILPTEVISLDDPNQNHQSTLTAISDWITSNFIIDLPTSSTSSNLDNGDGKLHVAFAHVSSQSGCEDGMNDKSESIKSNIQSSSSQPLWIEAEHSDENINVGHHHDEGGSVSVVIRCISLELGSLIVADMCAALGLKELSSVCDFEAEMEELKLLIDQVAELNQSRLRLTVDAAENVNKVKGLIIKGEDARLMGDMSLLKRHYINLYGVNSVLAMDYTKRSTTHEALLSVLREVNMFIERGSRLRLGSHRTAMVSQARAAIKANNASQLVNIIQKGAGPVR